MGFHVAACAAQAYYVELKKAFLPGACTLVETAEGLAVLGRDQIMDVSTDHIFRSRCADHRKTRFIHHQQRAVGGNYLDALGRRLEDSPETLLALTKGFLGMLAVGNVDQHI